MRRRLTIIGSGLVALGVALIVLRFLRDDRPTRGHNTVTSRLDVAAFRDQLALRVKRAREIAARRPEPLAGDAGVEPRSKAWASKGKGPITGVKDLIEPDGRCWAGPTELCAVLQPLALECSEGDARSCIAIGQYLTETPPRLLVAGIFFHAACRIGDEDGCKRLDAFEPGSTIPCEADPFACQWRAYKAQDMALHEEACSLGAAESCSQLAFDQTDDRKRHAYYETACQLGDMLACDVLAQLVAPDCEDGGANVCLPIDEEAGARAKEMACAAGFTDHC